jgi:hypothetical protein
MPFTMISDVLLARTDLSLAAKLLYARIGRYAHNTGECVRSQEGLAGDLGTPLRTVKRALMELRHHKLVEVKRRGRQPAVISMCLVGTSDPLQGANLALTEGLQSANLARTTGQVGTSRAPYLLNEYTREETSDTRTNRARRIPPKSETRRPKTPTDRALELYYERHPEMRPENRNKGK